MLEPPDIAEQALSACLREAFGLDVAAVAFLPLGADPHTAVFRAEAHGGQAAFVKLRAGGCAEVTLSLPRWLYEQGVEQIIPPLPTLDGRLCADLGAFTVIVYPFVAGVDGYARPLSAAQWRAFGAALRFLHGARPPDTILDSIPAERYADGYRRELAGFLDDLSGYLHDDPLSAELVAFLRARHAETHDLIARADRLAGALQASPPELVICHADAHAGNLLLADERLYIVDWDTLIRAPKERDLMFIGGGQGFRAVAPEQEHALFYAGYGPAQVSRAAIAYYRTQRIIEDLAIYCGDILLHRAAGADRAQALRYLMSNYKSGGTIDRAKRAAC